MQALYQMDMTGIDLTEVIAEFETHRLGQEIEGSQYRRRRGAFFRDLVEGVVREQLKIDPLIDRQLARRLAARRASIRILRAILRAGAYEILIARATCRRAWSSPNMSTSRTPSSPRKSRRS